MSGHETVQTVPMRVAFVKAKPAALSMSFHRYFPHPHHPHASIEWRSFLVVRMGNDRRRAVRNKTQLWILDSLHLNELASPQKSWILSDSCIDLLSDDNGTSLRQKSGSEARGT